MTDENDPEIDIKVDEVKKLCLEYSVEVTRSMIEIALNKKYPPSVRTQAGMLVLNRGLGMPRQAVEVKDTQKGSFISILRNIKKPESISEPNLEMFPTEKEASGQV